MATGAQTPALAPCASMRGGVRRVLRVSRPIARASPAPSRGTACVYGVLGRAIACAAGGSQHVGADATHIAHRPSHPVRGRVVSRAASANLGGGGLVSQDVPKMKVAELKLELEQRGLPTNGLKPALVERLSLYFACRDACRDGNGSMGGDEDASSSDAKKQSSSDDASSSDAKKQSSSDDASSSDAENQSADLSDSTYLRKPKADSSAGSVRPTKERESKPYQRTMFNSKPVDRVGGGVEINDDSVSNFSGMELTFLGTSSGSPSFTRNVSSYALRLTDEIWLFDCGEATQHQLMRSNLRYSKITRIFITHMHGDHIFGLPGLICALSGASAEKRRAGVHKDPEPLYITGPPGICEYVRATMSCSRTVLGLTLVVTELTAPGNGVPGYGADAGRDDQSAVRRQVHFAADHRCKMFLGERWPDNGASTAPVFKDKEGWKRAWAGQLELPFWTVHREKPANVGGSRGGPVGGLVVRAAPLRHPVPCFGYVIDEPDVAGRIDVDKCVALGLQPGKEYARLKNGFDVVAPDGTTITPTQVLGCDRPGRRLCLLGDTCDSIGIAAIAKGADVLIHESTFAAVKHDEAVYKGHSTSVMAGEFAQMISARNLLLTHFSNRYCEGGSDGSETYAGGKQQRDDEVEDDMALPEDAPVDMRAAAKEEFTAVQGLVREAAHAKGDLRVVAASDFFSFNVQRRETFDDSDRAKGNREALFDGPSIAPPLETYEDARARMADGVKGYYSPNYSGNGGAENRGRISGQGGYRGRGRGWGNDGFSGARGRGYGGRGGGSYHNDGGSGNGGYQSTGTVRGDGTRGFKRGEDGSFQRLPSSRNDSGGGESGGDHGNNGAPRRGRPIAVPRPTRGGSEAYQNVSRDRGVSVSPNAFDEN